MTPKSPSTEPEKPSIPANPGKCPECGYQLSNKNWRQHALPATSC